MGFSILPGPGGGEGGRGAESFAGGELRTVLKKLARIRGAESFAGVELRTILKNLARILPPPPSPHEKIDRAF